MNTVVAGDEGEAVPDGTSVLTLGRRSGDGRATVEGIELSSADRARPVARSSVWCTAVTTAEQADTLTDCRFPFAAVHGGADVRALPPHPDDPNVRALDVQWERARRLVDGACQVVEGPGALGHAGIAHLDQDGRDARGDGLKRYRKRLRRRLADLANQRPVVSPRGECGPPRG